MAIGAGVAGAGGQDDSNGGSSMSRPSKDAVDVGRSKARPYGSPSMKVPGRGEVKQQESQKRMKQYDRCACHAVDDGPSPAL
jgi:hypothetical protein